MLDLNDKINQEIENKTFINVKKYNIVTMSAYWHNDVICT